LNIYTIYRAVNKTNGKNYIGLTNNLKKRILNHNYSSFKENHKDYKSYFHNAIRKYGKENFTWEVIFQTKDEKIINSSEIYFIWLYNSYSTGYNSTRGGEGTFGYKHTEEAKQKMRVPNTFETRRKISLSKMGRVQSKEQTENHINFMTGRYIGDKNPMYDHTIYKFVHPKYGFNEMTRGELIKKFSELKLNTKTLGRVIRGKANSHKKWKVIL